MVKTGRGASIGNRLRRWLGWGIVVVLAAAPWSWFALRDLTPAMNAVAFALPVAGAMLALAAFGAAMLSQRMRLAIVSLSLAVFTAATVVGPRTAQPSPRPIDPFLLVASNTFDENPSPHAAVRALLARHADVLVVVETPPPLLIELRQTLGESSQRVDRLSVLSRWPVESLPPIEGVPSDAAMRAEVRRPGAPFVVYAVHLPNPLHEISWSGHARIVATLLRSAERERLPVVLAGDFNMSDRYTSYRLLDSSMRDAMRSSFAGSTYEQGLWGLLQLRIDHVFVSPALCASDSLTFSVPGSDHQGVEARIGACP